MRYALLSTYPPLSCSTIPGPKGCFSGFTEHMAAIWSHGPSALAPRPCPLTPRPSPPSPRDPGWILAVTPGFHCLNVTETTKLASLRELCLPQNKHPKTLWDKDKHKSFHEGKSSKSCSWLSEFSPWQCAHACLKIRFSSFLSVWIWPKIHSALLRKFVQRQRIVLFTKHRTLFKVF